MEEKRQSLGTQTPRKQVSFGDKTSVADDSVGTLKGFPSDANHVNILMEDHQTIGNLYTYIRIYL